MNEKSNQSQQQLWGEEGRPDLEAICRSCAGYASTPGWGLMRRRIEDQFGGFKGLKSAELGCGVGKMSALFALMGARATLVDYSDKQLKAAEFVHEFLGFSTTTHRANLLELPTELVGCFDVAMSFGTAEHFWGEERQRVFDAHVAALRPGGLTILWVPNRYGVLFQAGRRVRQWLGRLGGAIDETSFSRRELRKRARNAGLTDIAIRGGDRLSGDFNRFIINLNRRQAQKEGRIAETRGSAEAFLQNAIERNATSIHFWNNLFSYPLVLMGTRKK